MKKIVKALVPLLILLVLGACSDTSTEVHIDQETGKAAAVEASAESSAEASAEGAYTAQDVADMFNKPPAAETSTAPDGDAPVALVLPEDLTAGVYYGRSVYIHESGVAFWGAEETLCSALVDAEGGLYDPCVEIELPHYIWSITMIDDNMYLATDGGFYRLNLTEYNQGSTVMELLSETVLFNGFTIYDGNVYYARDYNLCRFPLDTGVEETLVSSVNDYDVTTAGIFFTTEGTGLYLMPHDRSSQTELLGTDADSSFIISGTNLYHWSGDGAYAFCYDLTTGTEEKISLDRQRYTGEYIWVMDDRLLYTDKEDDVYAHAFDDGREWELTNLYVLPDKHAALVRGEMMYYRYSETVYWLQMREDQRGSLSLSGFAEAPESTYVPAEPDAVTSATAETAPADYNISSGLNLYQSGNDAIVETDHFTMSLPADISWSLEIVDSDTIRFFHSQAYLEGYGGTFLTIHALDVGDESYLDWPDYSTLGTSGGKQYIATRPTDVQYNTSDPVQGEEYGDLLFHARLFYEFELDNPFHLK